MWWDAFPDEILALIVVFDVLEEERLKWRSRIRAEDIASMEEAAKTLEQEPIRMEFLEDAMVA